MRSSPKSKTDRFLLRLTLILCLLLLRLPVSAQTITGVASVTDGFTCAMQLRPDA